MLVIRPEQIGAFAKSVEEALECRLVAHVSRVLPNVYAQMGEHTVRKRVRGGMKTASAFGIEAEYELCRFVDLVFMLGADFCNDERDAWAPMVLRDKALSETAKMDELYNRLGKQLDAARAGEPLPPSTKE